MTAAGRWERTKSLFHAALEKPAGERNEFLTGACGGDEHLLREVNELVAADGEGGWLDAAADGVATSARMGETAHGSRIGPYRIVRELGRGGMGTVYLAERDDREFTRRVALKVIKRGMDTAFILKRFRNERQILAQLDHPNVARLLDGGTTEDDGLPFFVMEYIDGVPIGRWVRERNLPVPDRLRLFLDVCAGVSHAHQNLVIHRDIKPGNILVTEQGVPKLLDFGIAKILAPEGEESTATALPLFTPEYASPEQLRGAPLGTPSDVYLLGVLLFELLAGRRPSPATAHREAEPLRATDPKIPKDLDTIVAMALRFDPARRYPSVERFSEDVRQQLAGRPVSARNVTLGYRTATFVRRNRTGVAAGTLLAITLLTGLVATVWQARVAIAERARAERRLGQLRQLTGRVLFDYHDAIEPLPGATAVRERLVRDALSYLDALSKDAGENPELLRELAAAHLKVGDVQGRPDTPNLGDSEGAAKSYGSALSLLEGLLQRSPGHRDLRDQRALALERLSGLDARALRSGAAVRRARRAFSERYELLESRPEALFESRRMADVWFTLGTALWSMPAALTDPGISGEILSAFEASLALRDDIASHSSAPEDRWALVKSEEQLGHVLLSLGRSPEEALFHVDRARRVLSGLFGTTPRDARERRGLAGVTLVRGDALLILSGPSAALRAYQESLETFEDLLTVDPSNLEARRDVARVTNRIGLARVPRAAAGPPAARAEPGGPLGLRTLARNSRRAPG